MSFQPRVTQEVSKKLDVLFEMWHSGQISYPVKSTMAKLATALHRRRCDQAHQLHLALMVDYVSEVGTTSSCLIPGDRLNANLINS